MSKKRYIKEETKRMKDDLLFSLSMIGEIGFVTAIPLVAFGLLGRYLDRHFQTGPYLLLVCLALATILIFFSLKKIVQKSIDQFKELNK